MIQALTMAVEVVALLGHRGLARYSTSMVYGTGVNRRFYATAGDARRILGAFSGQQLRFG